MKKTIDSQKFESTDRTAVIYTDLITDRTETRRVWTSEGEDWVQFNGKMYRLIEMDVQVDGERKPRTIMRTALSGLGATWNAMTPARRSYAAHLVRDFGYPVAIAAQQSFLNGYDAWQYDYRAGKAVRETAPRSHWFN